MSLFWTMFGLVVAAILWGILVFNRLVAARNALREAWSGIDVQLKRRHELVPVLVACVAGYRAHEATLLERIARTRAGLEGADLHAACDRENALARDLRQLVAVAEAYPALKADGNFRDLSARLVAIEDQLQYARRYYNGTARDLNNLVQSIPSNVVARMFGFPVVSFFEVESAAERAVPEVEP